MRRRTSNIEHRTLNVERNPAPRAGITLLEVIISIGVLTIGLLGLAMLLPLGHYHNTQAENADRSAACGRSAFREIEARDMLRPERWLWQPSSGGWPAALPPLPRNPLAKLPATSPARPHSNFSAAPYLRTFMIDPNGVAANLGNTQSRFFPFVNAGGNLRMQRYTLDYLMYGPPNNSGVQQRLPTPEAIKSAADQLFTCRDDVALAPPANDEKGRPLMAATNQTLIQGDYSWMAMVTPSDLENPPRAVSGQPSRSLVPLTGRRLFTVAVIVMHKRVPEPQAVPPTEQQIDIPDVVVRGPRAIELNNVAVKITPNQWVMLSGELQQPSDESNLRRWVHRWYKVVSVGKDEAQPGVVRLNLAGPDWNPSILQGSGSRTYVTIVDKVVGVFERTVELDVRSLTSE